MSTNIEPTTIETANVPVDGISAPDNGQPAEQSTETPSRRGKAAKAPRKAAQAKASKGNGKPTVGLVLETRTDIEGGFWPKRSGTPKRQCVDAMLGKGLRTDAHAKLYGGAGGDPGWAQKLAGYMSRDRGEPYVAVKVDPYNSDKSRNSACDKAREKHGLSFRRGFGPATVLRVVPEAHTRPSDKPGYVEIVE